VTYLVGVPPARLRPLPLNTPSRVRGACGDVEVTLIDANHCPGAFPAPLLAAPFASFLALLQPPPVLLPC